MEHELLQRQARGGGGAQLALYEARDLVEPPPRLVGERVAAVVVTVLVPVAVVGAVVGLAVPFAALRALGAGGGAIRKGRRRRSCCCCCLAAGAKPDAAAVGRRVDGAA